MVDLDRRLDRNRDAVGQQRRRCRHIDRLDLLEHLVPKIDEMAEACTAAVCGIEIVEEAESGSRDDRLPWHREEDRLPSVDRIASDAFEERGVPFRKPLDKRSHRADVECVGCSERLHCRLLRLRARQDLPARGVRSAPRHNHRDLERTRGRRAKRSSRALLGHYRRWAGTLSMRRFGLFIICASVWLVAACATTVPADRTTSSLLDAVSIAALPANPPTIAGC